MRYASLISINPAAGSIGNHIFRANSVYDPDYTGTGHQPFMYDTLSTLYTVYAVLGSRMTACFIPSSSSHKYQVGINLISSEANPNGDIEGVKEQPRSVWGFVNNDGRKLYLSKNFSCKRFFGVADIKDNADLHASGTNPTRQAGFQIWTAPLDEVTDNDSIFVQVIVDFIVQWSEPYNVAKS